jgi:N utilization substance protein A
VSGRVKAFESNPEILAVINSIIQTDDYNLSREALFKIVEQAFSEVAKKIFGDYNNIKSKLNRNTGSVEIFRELEVGNDSDELDFRTQISLSEAKKLDLEAKVGLFVNDPLPIFDFNDSSIRIFRAELLKGISDSERKIEFEHFAKLKGTVVTGVVRKVAPSNLLVNIGKTEALIFKKHLLPQEASSYKPGARITALISDVLESKNTPQIILSRTDKNLLHELLRQEITEISDGVIEIKIISRDPGSRSKVAVTAPGRNLDPVRTCVGQRGQKIAVITEKLCNERIDIIEWNEDLKTFTKECLKGIPINKITIDEFEKNISIVVPKDFISAAIGRKGQNVWLISDMLKHNITILSEEEEKEIRLKQFDELTEDLMTYLEADEIIAQLLLAEGFKDVQKISQSTQADLLKIEGFTPEIADEIILRAKQATEQFEQNTRKITEQKLKFIDDLKRNLKIDDHLATLFISVGLDTPESIAELSIHELKDSLPSNNKATDEELANVILLARNLAQ